MTRDQQLIRLLSQIDNRIVSATLRSGAELDQLRDIDISGIVAADVLGWTHDALAILATDPQQPVAAEVSSDPAPQSSVQIETLAKGTPKITVKVYDASPTQAMAHARWLYDEAMRDYAEASTRVADKEAASAHT